jgi:hypothetical protein
VGRAVKGIIPDRIFYPLPHFLPFFFNPRKKKMANLRKSYLFYKLAVRVKKGIAIFGRFIFSIFVKLY